MNLGMRFAAWQKRGTQPLPYDAEVEWLQGDGVGAYIDTGISFGGVMMKDVIFDLEMPLVETPAGGTFFGFGTTSSAQYLLYSKLNFRAGNTSWTIRLSATAGDSLKITRDNNGWSAFINNEPAGTTTLNTISTKIGNDSTLCLFCRAVEVETATQVTRNNFSAEKIGAFKFTSQFGNVDFIPVRVGSVGYMYDRASGQLFGNAGTGAFIIGQDKPASNGGGYKCLTPRRSYRRSSRYSARFYSSTSRRWEVAA